MDKLSTVVYGVITLIVVVILIFSVAIPVVESAQKGETTKTMNTSERYMAVDDSGTLTASIADENYLTVNGEVIAPRLYYSPVAFAGDIIITAAASGSLTVYIYNLETSLWDITHSITSFSVSSGVFSYTQTDETTGSYDYSGKFYCVSMKGNYGFFSGPTNDDFYLDSNKTAMICVRAPSGAGVPQIKYTAQLSGAGVVTTISPMTTNTTAADNVVFDCTFENTDYGIHITDVSVSFSLGDQDYTIDDSKIVIIAPIEYTVIDDSSAIYVLLGVIPLILVIIPVMIAVQLIAGGRRD